MTYSMNVSEEFKAFTWTGQRVGSNHMTAILEELGFGYFKFDDEGNVIEKSNKPSHNHTCKLFKGHENYSMIVAVRNPYSMMISQATGGALEPTEENIKIARDRVENILQGRDFKNCCECFDKRFPDYVIRLENLFEDYLKIPFIKNHNIHLSGRLLELTNKTVNKGGAKSPLYWKNFISQPVADLIYYNFPDYFNHFGYEKYSWKS